MSDIERAANGCDCDFCTRKKLHSDNWCPCCAERRMEPPKWWENMDVCDECERTKPWRTDADEDHLERGDSRAFGGEE